MCLADIVCYCEDAAESLFTENETNLERLWGVPNSSPFVKDSINDRIDSRQDRHRECNKSAQSRRALQIHHSA